MSLGKDLELAQWEIASRGHTDSWPPQKSVGASQAQKLTLQAYAGELVKYGWKHFRFVGPHVTMAPTCHYEAAQAYASNT